MHPTHSSELLCPTCPARGSLLCSGMDEDEFPTLFELTVQVEVDPGEFLIMEGDSSEYVYNVRKGQLMLSRMSYDGRRQIMAFVYGGDYIGHTVSENYHFSAEAITPARLCRWKRDELEELVREHPKLAQHFRHMTSAILDNSLDLIFALGRKNALEKLASFLLYLSYRQKRQGRAPDPVQLPMTRTDIADFLGLTIETVSRAFGKLKQDGYVKMPTVHTVELVDEPRLRSLSTGGETYE